MKDWGTWWLSAAYIRVWTMSLDHCGWMFDAFPIFRFISPISNAGFHDRVRVNEIIVVWTMLMDRNLKARVSLYMAPLCVWSRRRQRRYKSSLRCHQVGRDGYGRRWLEAKCSTECCVVVMVPRARPIMKRFGIQLGLGLGNRRR